METEITVQVFETEEDAIKKISALGFEKLRQFNMNDSYFSKHDMSKLKKMQYKNVIKNTYTQKIANVMAFKNFFSFKWSKPRLKIIEISNASTITTANHHQ